MAYTINRYNKDVIATVADGTIDSTLDIKLIGKNYAGYGEVQNENFVNLLENFANDSEPSRPISGQIWFDSLHSKLKFYDGTKFRTAGGSEISATQPTGLSTGDFWYDTANNQLYALNESGSYTLIGPQGVAGSSTTQLKSRSVKDTLGGTHAIIEAIVNGVTSFVISSDEEFTLNGAINNIDGFAKVHKGITLAYTSNDTQPGQTTNVDRFWGTATNSDRLGGLSASDFVQADGAEFTGLVKFTDTYGLEVGNPVSKLRIYNKAATTPTIQTLNTDVLAFETASGNPLKLSGADILPGTPLISKIGTSNYKFAEVHATAFYGTIDQSDSLLVGTDYRTASTEAIIDTIAARDGDGNLKAVIFQGTATAARYADLAEKYLADAEYDVGTVLMIGGDKEVTACQVGFRAIGPVSEKPAHLMNSDLEGGTAIALKGRVPVKVVGAVLKGQRLIAAQNGTAQAAFGNNADCFAIALETNNEAGVKLVEALVL